MEKYCISVDWLEFNCYGNEIQLGNYVIAGRQFQVVDSHKHTRTFKNMYYLLYHGVKWATIRQVPRSEALKKGLTIIKIANRVLYSEKYVELAYSIMKHFNLRYNGITRLDLCYDCNKFYDGRNPARFVNNFVFKDPQEKGGVVRRGSDKFTAHGSRKHSCGSKITSIRFGSENNAVGCYMYDKTIELKEVKDKPWIRDMWEMNGLVSNDECHVWRTEISIKSGGKDLVNLETGQIFSLSPKYIEHYENIEKIFHFYASKYLDFRINNGQKNLRNYARLYLFNTEICVTCKPRKVSVNADTGRSEKVCYNTLNRTVSTYQDLSDSVRDSFYKAMDFMQSLSGIKASLTRTKNYENYLNHMKACKFFDAFDLAYLEVLEQGRLERIRMDAEQLYYASVFNYAHEAGLEV